MSPGLSYGLGAVREAGSGPVLPRRSAEKIVPRLALGWLDGWRGRTCGFGPLVGSRTVQKDGERLYTYAPFGHALHPRTAARRPPEQVAVPLSSVS